MGIIKFRSLKGMEVVQKVCVRRNQLNSVFVNLLVRLV